MNIKLGSNEDLTIQTKSGGIVTVPDATGTLFTMPSGGITAGDINSSSIASLGYITGTGITSIVALNEVEYAVLENKSATTLYVVSPMENQNFVVISDSEDSGNVVLLGKEYNTSDLTNNAPDVYSNFGLPICEDWTDSVTFDDDYIFNSATSPTAYTYSS